MEEELVKVQKLESLGVLAGGIAHDFNNILTAVLGNISLAQMHCQSPDKVKGRLVEAEKACIQAQGINAAVAHFFQGWGSDKEDSPHITINREFLPFRGEGVQRSLRAFLSQ